jgi:hypothetical protein
MNKKIEIVFDKTKEIAPLFMHYENDCFPQPAHVLLDLETGKVDARYKSEINTYSMHEFHGLSESFLIRNDLTGEQILTVLEDILPELQIIMDNSEIYWDGNNMRGRVTKVADEVADRLYDGTYLGEEMESVVITDLASWLSAGGPELWMPEENSDVQEFINDYDLDGYLSVDDLKDTLIEMWLNALENGERLSANIARYILNNSCCIEPNKNALNLCAEGDYEALDEYI